MVEADSAGREAREEVSQPNDGDAPERTERQQVLLVSGDDQICLCREGALQAPVVRLVVFDLIDRLLWTVNPTGDPAYLRHSPPSPVLLPPELLAQDALNLTEYEQADV